jgi:DNA-binding GntR family transcriptional regulator
MASVSLDLERVSDAIVLRDRIYESLKKAILSIDIYRDDLRLDERRLAEGLGVSRTPIREALGRLEYEGLVRTIPRRGAFVARKSKKEIVEMITVWAALESLAARLITERASDEEINSLRKMFATFGDAKVQARIDEYSDTNIKFHQAIFQISHSALLNKLTENLFLHMRWIRARTISERDRASRSIIDHMNIIEALETRNPDLAERLTKEHTLNLAAHVAKNVDWLD